MSRPQSVLSAPYLDATVRKILVCQLRQLGDVLLATPSVELLAKRFPNAEIHFFTEKKCAPLLRGNPHITKIWELDKKALPTLFHEICFYRKITAEGFDLVVDFQQLPRCRWVVLFSNAPIRLSHPPRWYQRLLYTHYIQPEGGYAAHYKIGLLAPLGITGDGTEYPRLYLAKDERRQAAEIIHGFMPEGARFISVDPSHQYSGRRWPARHFAKLMDMLAETDPLLHFVLTCGPGDERYVSDLRDLCAHSERVHISPVVSLRVAAAIIGMAAMHIGVCSAPRHMAVAMDTPSFVVLGAGGPGWTHPAPEHTHVFLDIHCRPCRQNTCRFGHLRCLNELLPEDVFPAALKHLQTYGKGCSRAQGS